MAMSAAQMIRKKAEIVASYLLRRPRPQGRPLIVSMQGPQGSGKSTICARLVDVLEEKGVVGSVASLDDFYHDHAGLKAVAAAHPTNALLSGRGPPGTHDIDLLASVLTTIRSGSPASLPVFDKSAHGGTGDRASHTVPLPAPSTLDIFVLEGWSLGYAPVLPATLEERWAAGATAHTHPLSSLAALNTHLAALDRAVGGLFDAHVAIRPRGGDYSYVYVWRTQQEHAMKAANGGRGMSDDDVRRFVDRYMPVYEVFGQTRPSPPRPTLTMVFGPEREVDAVEEDDEGGA